MTPVTTSLSRQYLCSASIVAPIAVGSNDTEELSGDRGIDAEAAEREAPKQSEHLVRTLTPIDGLTRRGPRIAH